MKEKFKINTHYKKYLELMNLPDESKLHPEQRKQLREAFYGAWSMCLIHMRDDVAELSDSKAVEVMEAQLQEDGDFWTGKTSRLN